MKNKYLLVFALLLIIPFNAFAAVTPKVLTVSADSKNSTINYIGTTEDGVYAVMCKLYNSTDEEIDMLSSSVDNKEFSGSFENVADGTYTVACARYEGGEVQKDTVIVKNTKTEVKEETLSNPKTYDSGIISNIIMLVISVLGIAGILYLKKRKKLNNN